MPPLKISRKFDISKEARASWKERWKASAKSVWVLILLLLNVALFVISMFIDVAPGLLIVVPVLLPIAQTLGMGSGPEAIHFGVGKVSINSMIPYVLRFILVMMIVQLLIKFVPFITTALPSLMHKRLISFTYGVLLAIV